MAGNDDPTEMLTRRFAPRDYVLALERTVAPGCDADQQKYIFLADFDLQAEILRGFAASTGAGQRFTGQHDSRPRQR
ncbi:hypothetical protein OU426_05285 [Frigidibacter sp. RF13]|uniref:hypothetical protein n=1 Tax=Frigidibacter sp. RF13 TaxID=2997340 RepID=UPI00226F5ADF|nr:hypothetical protein [Frigidibacter sp. RF13]MCY1126262.1 hypothetical protein [Frigidibacter sp. RF13]